MLFMTFAFVFHNKEINESNADGLLHHHISSVVGIVNFISAIYFNRDY